MHRTLHALCQITNERNIFDYKGIYVCKELHASKGLLNPLQIILLWDNAYNRVH